jgi:hypothetical protein
LAPFKAALPVVLRLGEVVWACKRDMPRPKKATLVIRKSVVLVQADVNRRDLKAFKPDVKQCMMFTQFFVSSRVAHRGSNVRRYFKDYG